MLTDDSQIVNLNVGGTLYTTYLSTLKRFPESMLARMFSGKHTVSTDDKGNYFIDRDGKLFRSILNYLREPEDLFPPMTGELQVEARYFGLLHNIFPYRPRLSSASVCSIQRDNLIYCGQQGTRIHWGQWAEVTVVITRNDVGTFFASSTRCNIPRSVLNPFTNPTAGSQSLSFVDLPLIFCTTCRWLHVVLLPSHHDIATITPQQQQNSGDRRLILRVHAEYLNNGIDNGTPTCYKIFNEQCGECFESHTPQL